MKVLVLGANGFIGSHIVTALMSQGYTVIAGVRNTKQGRKRFPQLSAVACDFSDLISQAAWQNMLHDIDVVINCIGVLQTNRRLMQKIHVDNPKGLFMACQSAKVRLIHLSALAVETNTNTDYANSKYIAEKILSGLAFPWVILKPSLVIAQGSYGGTSLMRGLAALPGLIPLVGAGQQKFQPVAMQDLVQAVLNIIARDQFDQSTLNIVGAEKQPLREIIRQMRNWLGLGPARFIRVPLVCIRAACKLGDLFNLAPINTTALKMLLHGNTCDVSHLETLQVEPKTLTEALWAKPSCIQDRLHARLYFMKPLLQILMGSFWLISGLLPLLNTASQQTALRLLQLITLPGISAVLALKLSCAWDILLGLWMLSGRRLSSAIVSQFLTVVAYTLAITHFSPELWLDPFGSVLKNLPILLGLVIFWILSKER